jgi:hypothetical protein
VHLVCDSSQSTGCRTITANAWLFSGSKTAMVKGQEVRDVSQLGQGLSLQTFFRSQPREFARMTQPLPPPIQLRRGADRVRVRVQDGSTGTAVDVIVEAPGDVTLECVRCSKRKEARAALRALVERQLAQGFEPDETPWVDGAPAAPPRSSPPAGGKLVSPAAALARCPPALRAALATVAAPVGGGGGVGGDAKGSVLVFEHGFTTEKWPNDARGPVLVLGNVNCPAPIDDPFATGIFVAGNLRCQTLVLRGEFCCTGNVDARDFVVVNASNDFGFHVDGTVTTPLFLEEGTASYARAFQGEVWRCMNEVHDAQGPLAMTPPAVRTRARLRALGWSDTAIDSLVDVIGSLE